MKKVAVSFDFDEKIAKMLEEMAKEKGKSENEVVEEIILKYCVRSEKKYKKYQL